MKNLRNTVKLIGHLGNEPTIKKFKNGSQKAILILATNESYKKLNGEYKITTQWHTLIVKDALVDIVEKYVKKGMQLSINGRLISKSWKDKTGKSNYRTEIEVSELLMLNQMIA
ncbi:MAG: single-stranded DNA-binding protein [Bacteroidetes bacterium]|nr:MAG: single-stranded DNA-binding protein [Bacteroidota bacterium]